MSTARTGSAFWTGVPVVVPGSAAAWLLAARPKTLAAAFAPVAVGTACAHAVDSLAWGPALAALLGAVLIQVGTNFANDLYDHLKGADTAERLGPVRAAQAGLLRPASLRWGMAAVFGLACICGLYLAAVAGWTIFAVGIAYTGGPYPLAYNGLGDVFVFVFFGGVAVCGTAFVQHGSVPSIAFLGALPVGALATVLLVVNNIRDEAGDRSAGKRTLVVRFGRQAAEAQLSALMLLAFAAPLGIAVHPHGGLCVLLPWCLAPSAHGLRRRVLARRGRELNQSLAETARLLLLFSLLLSFGLFVGPR